MVSRKSRSVVAFAATAAIIWLPATAQEPPAEHPAFASVQLPQLSVQATVPDIPKLEAKAVEILRTKHGLTLEEARAKVRIDGKTDVARCLEVVIFNALSSISQADVTEIRVSLQHPEPQP